MTKTCKKVTSVEASPSIFRVVLKKKNNQSALLVHPIWDWYPTGNITKVQRSQFPVTSLDFDSGTRGIKKCWIFCY